MRESTCSYAFVKAGATLRRTLQNCSMNLRNTQGVLPAIWLNHNPHETSRRSQPKIREPRAHSLGFSWSIYSQRAISVSPSVRFCEKSHLQTSDRLSRVRGQHFSMTWLRTIWRRTRMFDCSSLFKTSQLIKVIRINLSYSREAGPSSYYRSIT